jgi:hypothetical protein
MTKFKVRQKLAMEWLFTFAGIGTSQFKIGWCVLASPLPFGYLVV